MIVYAVDACLYVAVNACLSVATCCMPAGCLLQLTTGICRCIWAPVRKIEFLTSIRSVFRTVLRWISVFDISQRGNLANEYDLELETASKNAFTLTWQGVKLT